MTAPPPPTPATHKHLVKFLLSSLETATRCDDGLVLRVERAGGRSRDAQGSHLPGQKRKAAISGRDRPGGLLAPHSLKFLMYKKLGSVSCRPDTVLRVGRASPDADCMCYLAHGRYGFGHDKELFCRSSLMKNVTPPSPLFAEFLRAAG